MRERHASRLDCRPLARTRRWVRAWAATFGSCILIVGIIIVAGYASASGCAGDPKRAARVLKQAGYTSTDVGGADGLAGCHGTSNVFSAVSPAGTYIEGVVCCPARLSCNSMCSIRFDGEGE